MHWKSTIENMNQEIMRSFSNFKNGTAILQVRGTFISLLDSCYMFEFLKFTYAHSRSCKVCVIKIYVWLKFLKFD